MMNTSNNNSNNIYKVSFAFTYRHQDPDAPSAHTCVGARDEPVHLCHGPLKSRLCTVHIRIQLAQHNDVFIGFLPDQLSLGPQRRQRRSNRIQRLVLIRQEHLLLLALPC